MNRTYLRIPVIKAGNPEQEGDYRLGFMDLTILSGRANRALARSTAALLDAGLGRCKIEEFPDNELRIEIQENLRDHDVYLIQPVSPPVAENLLELLMLADACRRAGASRLTAVLPYLGYARQDRRYGEGEAVGGRLIADVLCTRFDRIITVDLHNPAIEGFFSIPLEHISATRLLAQNLWPLITEGSILVAPDLGAVKLAQKYASLLDLPVAYIHKVRVSGEKVRVSEIIGDIKGRSPVLVDDMISTGGTIVSALDALMDAGARKPITVAATHGLLVGGARRNLSLRPVGKLILSDSIHLQNEGHLAIERISLDQLLARAVERQHTEIE